MEWWMTETERVLFLWSGRRFLSFLSDALRLSSSSYFPSFSPSMPPRLSGILVHLCMIHPIFLPPFLCLICLMKTTVSTVCNSIFVISIDVYLIMLPYFYFSRCAISSFFLLTIYVETFWETFWEIFSLKHFEKYFLWNILKNIFYFR